jgi:hypothetical protein
VRVGGAQPEKWPRESLHLNPVLNMGD